MSGGGHISHIVKMHYFFSTLGDGLDKHKKDSFEDVPIDSYCINRLHCGIPLALMIFIYSMMIDMLICKYEPF